MAKPSELPQLATGQPITPQDLVNRPLAQYYQLRNQLVNVQSYEYFDTAVFTAGTAVTSAQKQALFTKGRDQDTTVFNTGVAIPEKGMYMTNMISDGEFEGGTTFICERVGVFAVETSELPTTLGTRGEITAPNYTASVVISAANNLLAYLRQLEGQFRRNGDEIKFRKPLISYGSPWGISGAIGSPNAGFIQNAGPSWELSRPMVLESEDKFSFVIEPLVATFTPTMGLNVTVVLGGTVIKTPSF